MAEVIRMSPVLLMPEVGIVSEGSNNNNKDTPAGTFGEESGLLGSGSDCDGVDVEIEDPIFSGIQRDLVDTADNERAEGEDNEESVSYTSLQFGFIPKYTYEHNHRHGEILSVCYNSRYRKFLIVDQKGVTSWMFEARSGQKASRLLNYPKYKYRLYSNVLYTRKHNVYFALGRDFSLKILNSNFEETYTVDANLRNVMFLLFNQQTDELITGGVGGTKVWSFAQVVETKGWKAVRAMANYKLIHKYTLHNVGGGWVKKVELDNILQHLYCCSETDLYTYDLEGNELFTYKNAHDMSITGCVFSAHAQLLVTSSLDCTVKCWSIQGGLVHTFRGHSKAVTQILMHPETSALILSSSLDATVRLWSLHTMDCIYSITISLSGIQWMGLTDDKLLYTCTNRQLTLWNLNHFAHFYGLTRSNAVRISSHPSNHKSTRTMVISEDSCIRLFSQANADIRRVSTVLPMPSIPPSERVLCVSYSRELNLVYCLVTRRKLWIYTARTDPACRIGHWDLAKIQGQLLDEQFDDGSKKRKRGQSSASGILPLWLKKLAAVSRALQAIHPGATVSSCHCICILKSPVMMWAKDGPCSPRASTFLLLGLEDGRIMFMDPFVRGRRHMDFKANKDPITDIRHNEENENLITRVNAAGVTVLQIWSLPELDLMHELQTFKNLVDYAQMEAFLFCGYADGSISFQAALPDESERSHQWSGQIKSEDDLIASNLVQKRHEHTMAILSVDNCTSKGVFLSCSMDGVVKMWSAETQAAVSEVTMNGPLSTAGFLNRAGDILLGFHRNLFCVEFRKVYPAAAGSMGRGQSQDSIMTLADSDVYEDAAIRYEGVLSSAGPLTLKTYLKPYDLEFTKEFVEGSTVIKTANPAEDAESVSSDEGSDMSAASTQVYMSPFITPGISMVELALFDQNADARVGDDAYLQQIAFDMLDITDPKVANHYRVLFGQSPGGTPTVSSPSVPSTPSGDFSSAEDENEVDDEADSESHPVTVAATSLGGPQSAVKAAQQVQAAKSAAPALFAVDAVPRKGILDGLRITMDTVAPTVAVKSRFALEGSMKIDAKQMKVKPKQLQEEEKHSHKKVASQPERSAVLEAKPRAIQKKRANEVHKRPAAGKTKRHEEDEGEDYRGKTSTKDWPALQSTKEGMHSDEKDETKAAAKSNHEEVAKLQRGAYNDVKVPPPIKLVTGKVPTVLNKSKKKNGSPLHLTNVTSKSTHLLLKPPPATAIDMSHVSAATLLPDNATDTDLNERATVKSKLLPPRERYKPPKQQELPPMSPEMVGGELLVGSTYEDEDAGLLSDAANGRDSSEVFHYLSQPQTGMRKGISSSGSRDLSIRPWTTPPEVGFLPEDLLRGFEEALIRFQGDKDVVKLLKFTGIAFDDHWHENIIERHRLLLMQKNLRVHSAAHNRRLLDERRLERFTSHLGASVLEKSYGRGSSPEAFMRLLMRLSASPSVITSSLLPRSEATPAHRTATLADMPLYRHAAAAAAADAAVLDAKARRATETNTQYRFRIKGAELPSPNGLPGSTGHRPVALDAKLMDPRNPEALRPHSSKSIPSKCTRYILVKRQREHSHSSVSAATSVEAQLLRQRFPSFAEHTLKDKSQKAIETETHYK